VFRIALVMIVAATVAIAATGAEATAPPVGPLPQGQVSTMLTQNGALVAVALPRKTNGLVWRLARQVDPKVLRQVSEANVGTSVVIVFRAVGRGKSKIVFALTKGETAKAYAAVTQDVTVR
jgi:hypothetical protein